MPKDFQLKQKKSINVRAASVVLIIGPISNLRRDESPLSEDLSNIASFGWNKVCSNVRIEGKLTVPYVLKMNLQSGEFVPITEVQTLSRHIGHNEHS